MEVKASLPENSSCLQTDETFQDLFKQFYAIVVRKVMLIVKEQTVAEDIAQEVFMKLYHSDWEEIDHIQGWLTKVAVNTAYNYIRTEKRYHAREKKQKLYQEDAASSIEDAYMKLENISEVQKALVHLNERDRQILIMKYSGYSYEEIAKNVGQEKSSIGTLLARAKKRFKKYYMNLKGESADDLS